MKRVFIKVYKFFGKIYRYIFYGKITEYFFKLFIPCIYYTKGNESAISINLWFFQKVLGFNKHCYWPVHFTSKVTFPQNIYVGIDAAPGISPGCYIQAIGKIYLGNHVQIAPNVGLISSNHFMLDIRHHVKNEIKIGDYSRIGMGSIILPGVVLGEFTTVSAGSVVTTSFPDGFCVIAGNPAKIVQDFSKNESIKSKFLRYNQKYSYNGYIPTEKFEAYRKKYLKV